jgi:DNA-binding IscR family transcriptional regulator
MGEIIRIVRRLEGLSEPAAEPGGSRLGTLVVRPIWLEMQDEMMARLDRLTVAELCQRARTLGVETG